MLHQSLKKTGTSSDRGLYTLAWKALKQVHSKEAPKLNIHNINGEHLNISGNLFALKGSEMFYIPMIIDPSEGKQGFPAHVKLHSQDDVLEFEARVRETLKNKNLSKLGEVFIPKTQEAKSDIAYVMQSEEAKGLPEFSVLSLQLFENTIIGKDEKGDLYLPEGSPIMIDPKPLMSERILGEDITRYVGIAMPQKPEK
jgi:hypothetical protein